MGQNNGCLRVALEQTELVIDANRQDNEVLHRRLDEVDESMVVLLGREGARMRAELATVREELRTLRTEKLELETRVMLLNRKTAALRAGTAMCSRNYTKSDGFRALKRRSDDILRTLPSIWKPEYATTSTSWAYVFVSTS